MLKIKDNVDLKELEKFGFKQDKNIYYKKRLRKYVIGDRKWDYLI